MGKITFPLATTTAREAATPLNYEILYDTDEARFYTGDTTTGGIPLIGVTLYEAGILEGFAESINFTGSGVDSITISNFAATVTISGGGGTASIDDIWLYSVD